MSRLKKRQRNLGKKKDLSGFENLTGLTVEYDSCYRGKIEIWRDDSGRVVSQKIIR